MTEQQEILKELQDIKVQQARLEAHIKSELGNHTRQLDALWKSDIGKEKRLRDQEDWRNNIKGRLFVTGWIAGFLAGILGTIIVTYLTNKK